METLHVLCGLEEADVVYALRMQRERMEESFVPSIREYAAHFQIDSRRLGPRQLLMHPGPVNRGVELSGEVIDSPQSLIAEQVAAGLVVRMAILYELLASGERRRRRRAGTSGRSPTPDGAAGVSRRHPRDARRARAPTWSCARRTVLDPAAGIDGVHDVVVRDGAIAELAPPGRGRADGRRGGRGRRACTPSPPSSTRTSTCAPPATSTRRTSRPAPGPPPPAATAE